MSPFVHRLRVLAVGLVFSSAGWIAPAAAVAQTTGAVVAPHPLISRHIVLPHRQTQGPPTTAECRQFGFSCYQAPQIQKAYNLGPLFAEGFNGAGRTIVIVDSFGSPTIANDLHVFDQAFNLPDPPSLQIITPAGPVTFDTSKSDTLGWGYETTLDVEWAHTMAPGAKILLVETPVSETEGVTGFPEMMLSENFVINHNMGDVISQSFGATEETFPNAQALLNLRGAFMNAKRHKVTVLAASGDFGSTDAQLNLSCCYPFQVNSWPSSDPLVTSVGGTLLTLDDAGNRISPDVVWNDGSIAGGGGPSHVFSRPNFQNSVRKVVGSHRGTPDISLSASCSGVVDVYETFDPNSKGWALICGTSEASPLFSGIVAIADQMAGHRLGLLNDRLYRLMKEQPNGVVDVTSGNNGITFCQSACGTAGEVDVTVPGFAAGPGYDMASGLGTIDANRFVRALAQNDQGNNNSD
jgi:subtilase family serine protease